MIIIFVIVAWFVPFSTGALHVSAIIQMRLQLKRRALRIAYTGNQRNGDGDRVYFSSGCFRFNVSCCFVSFAMPVYFLFFLFLLSVCNVVLFGVSLLFCFVSDSCWLVSHRSFRFQFQLFYSFDLLISWLLPPLFVIVIFVVAAAAAATFANVYTHIKYIRWDYFVFVGCWIERFTAFITYYIPK